jgi:hypothetical protein
MKYLLLLSLLGCTVNYDYEYEKLNATQDAISDIKEVPKKVQQKTLTLGQEDGDFFRDDAPVLQLAGGSMSRFHLYQFYADAGDKVKITMIGMCSCFGIKKSIIDPRFVVFNRDGSWQNDQAATKQGESIVEGTSVRIENKVEFEAPAGGSYFLVAYGDNQAQGEYLINDVESTDMPGLVTKFNVSSSPIGQYKIKVEKLKK